VEVQTEALLDSITQDYCFSVKKQSYIIYNEEATYLGEPERRAFAPGEFEELKAYAPEFENVANAIWTPEVVAAWMEKRQGDRS